MRLVFAGDRDIAESVLRFILDKGEKPLALIVSENASHGADLIRLVPDVPVYVGREFAQHAEELRGLDLDYILGIHFPHLIPKEILEIPRVGVLNLHPAYLPFNRGWHTPSWAILENTPTGATLHFMNEDLDTGEIVHQKILEVQPDDTAHTLYRRMKDLEMEVFAESWLDLLTLDPPRRPQGEGGTSHRKAELFQVQEIDFGISAGELLRRLRALTTNRIDEAAFFEEDGKRYRVRVEIVPEE